MSGGEVIPFPVLEIELTPSDELLRPGGLVLDQFALAVFVSVYSVASLAQVLPGLDGFPASLEVAAIGPATAEALVGLGIPVQYLPQGSSDSEGLLRSLAQLSVQECNVVLYRGNAGRDVVVEELDRRGARVYSLECYRRRPHSSPPLDRLDEWLARPAGILLVTSVAVLQALVAVTPPVYRSRLFRQPVVALSDRIRSACRTAGFLGPVQSAGNTGTEAIVRALADISRDAMEPA